MEQRDDRARAVAKVEPEGDVDDDQQDRAQQRLDAVVAQLLARPWRPPSRPAGSVDGAGAELASPARFLTSVSRPTRVDLVGVIFGAAEPLHLGGVDARPPSSDDGQRRRLDRAGRSAGRSCRRPRTIRIRSSDASPSLASELARPCLACCVRHAPTRRRCGSCSSTVSCPSGAVVLDDLGAVESGASQASSGPRPTSTGFANSSQDLGAAAEVDAPVQHVPAALDDVGVERKHRERDQRPGRARSRSSSFCVPTKSKFDAGLDDLEELLSVWVAMVVS